MTEMDHSVSFYQKTAELQEKLRKSEEERLKLEEKFAVMMGACREEEEARLLVLQDSYEKFLREDRKRRERNNRILQTLERIESQTAIMSAKTNRLKLLRQHYEAYLMRVYPEWKLQGQVSKRKNSVHAEHLRPHYMSHQFAPSQSSTTNSVIKYPSTSQANMYRHTNTGPDSVSGDKSPTFRPSVNIVDYTKLPFSSSLKNFSNVNKNILPNKHLGVISSDQDFATKPELGYGSEILGLRNGQLESNLEKSLGAVGSNILKPSEDSRFGSILDLEMEQNTSRDLLNVSLSDDGVVQEEACPSMPVHNSRLLDDAIDVAPPTKESAGSSKSLLVDPAGVEYLHTTNVCMKAANHTADKHIKTNKPENDLTNYVEAGLRCLQPLPSTINIVTAASRQEERKGDATMDFVPGLDISGFHESSDKLNCEVNGSRQYGMVPNGKVDVNKDSRNGEEHFAVKGKEKDSAKVQLPLESSVQSARVEFMQCIPELALKHQSNELPLSSQMLQGHENNQPHIVLKTDCITSEPAPSMYTTNKMGQGIMVPLLETEDNGQERESAVKVEISKQSDNEGQHIFYNKKENDYVREESMAVSIKEDTKKDGEKLNEENSLISESLYKLSNENELAKIQVFVEKEKQFPQKQEFYKQGQYTGDLPEKSVYSDTHKTCNEKQNYIHHEEEHEKMYAADEAEKCSNVGEERKYIMDTGQYQTVSERGQNIVDEAGKYQKVDEDRQYVVDEAEQYQKVGEDGQYIVDEAGQYQKVGEDGQYIVDEAEQYQKVGEDGQYIVDEAGQYQQVGEDGQYIVDEAGQYQKVGEDGQYIVDEAGQYQTVGEEGQYILDEMGQYQKVGEDGQFIVDEAGQYQKVDEDGQYIVDEARQYQTVSEEGQYIVDEMGQYQKVDENGQYSVDEAGQYQKVDEDGQYIVDDAGQYQTVGEEGQYIVDEMGQYKKIGEDGQYTVDERVQYQTAGEAGHYFMDETGQYQKVGEDGQYIMDEAEHYQTVGEEGQYIVDEAGQYQKVGKDEQYIMDEAGQYVMDEAGKCQAAGEGGDYIVGEAGQYHKVGDDEHYIVDETGQCQTDSKEEQCGVRKSNEYKNDVKKQFILNESGNYQTSDEDGRYLAESEEYPYKPNNRDKYNSGEDDKYQQQTFNVESSKEQKQKTGAEHEHFLEHGQYSIDNQCSDANSKNVAHVGGEKHLEEHSEKKRIVLQGADHAADGRNTTSAANTRNSAGDLHSSQTGPSISDSAGSGSNLSEAVEPALSSSRKIVPERDTVAEDVQEIGKSQQELSRELMNQHVKDVLGGLGQESSDESSDVPALLPPVAEATPVQEPVLGMDAPSVTLRPVKNPLSKAAGPKKLPGLTRMLESDSDSLQLDANLATSNDESDDFDFSSEK